MTANPVNRKQLEQFTEVIRDLRGEADLHLARLNTSMVEVQMARSDGAADDEHDPDGPTMSQEWSRLTGLLRTAEAELAMLNAALSRLSAGTYGRCVRCSQPIALARLEARPAAELCIECARLVR